MTQPTPPEIPMDHWASNLLALQNNKCAFCRAPLTYRLPAHMSWLGGACRMLCMPCVRVLGLAGTAPHRYPATVVALEDVLRDQFHLAAVRGGRFAATGVAKSPHKIVVAFYQEHRAYARAQTAHDKHAKAVQSNANRLHYAASRATLLSRFGRGDLPGYAMCLRCNTPKPHHAFRSGRLLRRDGIQDRPCRLCETVSDVLTP